MEYYSVCTLIRSGEQVRYESALEASPELISQSALWELQTRRNTAGYFAERKEFFACRLAFITPWIRVHCHQLHGPSSTARAAMTSAVEDEPSGQAFGGSTTAGSTDRPFPPLPHCLRRPQQEPWETPGSPPWLPCWLNNGWT